MSKCLGDFFWNFTLSTLLAHSIITFRLPLDTKIKERWTEAIENANQTQFRGSGMICLQHFQDDQFKRLNNRLILQRDAVPCVFSSDSLVEVIHINDDFNPHHTEPICESCEGLKNSFFVNVTEQELYKTKAEIKINKLIESNKKKSSLIAELTSKIARMENEKFKLENKYSQLVESQLISSTNNDKVHIILINS